MFQNTYIHWDEVKGRMSAHGSLICLVKPFFVVPQDILLLDSHYGRSMTSSALLYHLKITEVTQNLHWSENRILPTILSIVMVKSHISLTRAYNDPIFKKCYGKCEKNQTRALETMKVRKVKWTVFFCFCFSFWNVF